MNEFQVPGNERKSEISGRIVGGRPTTIDRFPWQLSLRINGNHRCGASVISENRALSAAHCYKPTKDNLNDFTILAGSTSRYADVGSLIIGLEKYIQHPNYNNSTLINGNYQNKDATISK